MQALRFYPPGGPEKLKFTQEPVPNIEDDEVLIEVHAVSVIWTELNWPIYQREDGSFYDVIPGQDYSGIVKKPGANVEESSVLHIGAEVIAFNGLKRDKDGGMAQYAKVPATAIVPKPQLLSLVDSTSVPLSALTAWQALFEHGDLRPGQTLLVTGAAGPTTLWGVQMAKTIGAKVIGTASSPWSFETLNSLGIDRILNYKEVDVSAEIQNVDMVLDAVGGDAARQSIKTVKKGGKLISICDPSVSELGKETGVDASFFIVSMNQEQLRRINGMIDEGKLKTFVDKVFDFEDGVKAFEYGAEKHSRGKILLRAPRI